VPEPTLEDRLTPFWIDAARHVRDRARMSNAVERDLAQLRERLGRYLDESQITCASEDVIDIGHAILEADWESRWPKRPRWLATRLHGDAPPTL
jgi:hypothetical protein